MGIVYVCLENHPVPHLEERLTILPEDPKINNNGVATSFAQFCNHHISGNDFQNIKISSPHFDDRKLRQRFILWHIFNAAVLGTRLMGWDIDAQSGQCIGMGSCTKVLYLREIFHWRMESKSYILMTHIVYPTCFRIDWLVN